jgi:hypothetical protein
MKVPYVEYSSRASAFGTKICTIDVTHQVSAEIQKQREAEKDGGSDKENGESADVLGEHEDDDVIF